MNSTVIDQSPSLPPLMEVIDSHTGGEPTRVVISGGPHLDSGTCAEQAQQFHTQFDHYRRAVVLEPRGHEVLVGALLLPAIDPSCVARVIFFNNVGLLGMCGHGMMGLAVTLAHLGKIGLGKHQVETPVGQVGFEYQAGNQVAVRNVASYRLARQVNCDVPDWGRVTGDIAWGGNWFFIVNCPEETFHLRQTPELTARCMAIRQALQQQGITGSEGHPIDHIELCGLPRNSQHHSRNFVLCPGDAYDRSPCGTGTSAKLACLIDEGNLQPGEIWLQESITGSLFFATAERNQEKIVPTITGTAHITAETRLLFPSADPLRWGIERHT